MTYVHRMATAYASTRPAATMTARMVVMMTPEEKRALEARARDLDMTSSELLRRASQSYEPMLDEALLAAIADQIEANNAAMQATLEATLARVDANIAKIDALRAAHNARAA